MLRWNTVCALALMVVVDSCTCDAQVAACEQTLTALCELEETCGGGAPRAECQASRPDFTCTVDVDSAEVCVEAINDALRSDCAAFDGATLPCPLLDQAGLYQPCDDVFVCAAGAPCVSGVDVEGGGTICSANCDASTPCPGGGGCSGDGFCAPVCAADFVCADTELCVDGACTACLELCGDGCGAVVDGCDCPVCCNTDDDCGGTACVGGVCE